MATIKLSEVPTINIGTKVSSSFKIEIGPQTCTQENGIAIGRAAKGDSGSIVIGTCSLSTCNNTVIIGDYASGSKGSVVLGVEAQVRNIQGIAIGRSANTGNGIVIGFCASESHDNGLVIGNFTTSCHCDALIIGHNSRTTDDSEIIIGSNIIGRCFGDMQFGSTYNRKIIYFGEIAFAEFCTTANKWILK